MRLLYISAEPLRPAQASFTHTHEIVGNLTALGHVVTLCASEAKGSYDSTPLRARLSAYISFWHRAFFAMKNADAVYSRAHPASLPLALAAKLRRIPVVHEINGPHEDIAVTHGWIRPFLPLIRAAMRWQLRNAEALVAVTPGLAEKLRAQAPSVPVSVVMNGVNHHIFNPQALPMQTAKKYALFFGGMTRWHGVETMLEALTHTDWPYDLDLIMIGEGQLSDKARAAVSADARLHVLLPMPQNELAQYINGATLGLVPVTDAGGRGQTGLAPLKLYEMLACALPVVVTDFPVQADLVRALNAGTVAPSENPAALAQAVAALAATPPPRDTMLAAAKIIASEHSWAARAIAVDAVLKQLNRRVELAEQ